MPAGPVSRPWKRLLRLRVRGLIVLVLVLGAGLGWLVRMLGSGARRWRRSRDAGGLVDYDWEHSNRASIRGGKPWGHEVARESRRSRLFWSRQPRRVHGRLKGNRCNGGRDRPSARLSGPISRTTTGFFSGQIAETPRRPALHPYRLLPDCLPKYGVSPQSLASVLDTLQTDRMVLKSLQPQGRNRLCSDGNGSPVTPERPPRGCPGVPDRQPRFFWNHCMTLPITITITATSGDHFRAETPAGPVEASSLRELGDRLRDFLATLEDESASDLVELARLSRSATDQDTLLELARTSPPPDAWFGDD